MARPKTLRQADFAVMTTTVVLLNVRHDLATPADQHPMMAPGPVRVVHRGDVLAQPEISADPAPSPTPNRTWSQHIQRQRRGPLGALDVQFSGPAAVAGDDAYPRQSLVAACTPGTADRLGPRPSRGLPSTDCSTRRGIQYVRPSSAPLTHFSASQAYPYALASRRRKLQVQDTGPLADAQPRSVQTVDEGAVPVLVEAPPACLAHSVERVSAQPDVPPLLQGQPQQPLHLLPRRAVRTQRSRRRRAYPYPGAVSLSSAVSACTVGTGLKIP